MTGRSYTLSRIWVTPVCPAEEGLTFEEAVAGAQHWAAQFRDGERGVTAQVTNEDLRADVEDTGLTEAEQAELEEALALARRLARVA